MMSDLTPKEIKRLERLKDLKQKGLVGVFKYLLELDDEIERLRDMADPTFKKILDKLKGEKGDSGVKGEKGDKGDRGEKGDNGKDGKNGRDGMDGRNGTNGRDGVDGKDGKDGIDADESKILERVEQDLPILGESIRDSLELLTGDERLDKSAIKGLDEALKEVREIKPSGTARGVPLNTVLYEDLSSQCDGSNKVFQVPSHRKIVLLTGTDFPIIYRPLIDYTKTGEWEITLADSITAPADGATLIFQYIK